MINAKIYFYDTDDKLVEEKVEGRLCLEFLYTAMWGRVLRFLFTRRIVSKLYAFYQNSKWSKRRIVPFIKKHDIEMSECQQKADEFKSFNDFFCRKLKDGARPIDPDVNAIVSPADSKLFVIPNISNYVSFFVKNETFNLAKFLDDTSLAGQFEGGALMIFRLAPPDYHHFHFPVDCKTFKFEPMGRLLESVNPIVYRTGVQPLTTNVRYHYVLETSKQEPVVMTAVGAMMVGSVVETFETDQKCIKGQEAGYFQFGGSTITLLFKQGFVKPLQKYIDHSAKGFESAVRLGQRVADLV